METMVRCVECGYDNNPQYRFCGMCGVTLRPPEAPRAEPQDLPAKDPSQSVEPVSGPSFLGLAGDNSPGAEYLLEDTASQGHGKLFAFLVLLVAAAAFLGWRWHRYGYILPKNAMAMIASKAQNAPPAAAGENGQMPPGADNANATTTPDNSAENKTPAIEVLDQPPANAKAGNSGSATTATNPGSTGNTEQTQDNGTTDTGDQGTSPAAMTENSGTTGNAATQTPAPATPSTSSTKAATAPPVAKNTRVKPAVAHTAQAPEAATPEQSESEALAVQGERYLYGTGVAQNCGLAQRSLLSAASRGSAHAETLLGAMYATGHCATRNLPTAYRWFARALHQQPSNSRISADLEVLWKQMTPDERQLATKAE